MLFLTAPLWFAAALALPAPLHDALEHGTFRSTPTAFRVIALSHIADGCAARARDAPAEARACVARAFAQAKVTKPKGADLDDGRAGLWLTHLALILGAGDETGACLDETLHRRVIEGLTRASLADAHGHTSSYAARRERWPADQAATLAAIGRYDRAHRTTHVVTPLARYREAVAAKHMPDTTLPWSELHGAGSGKLARGCALSYSVRYLSEVDLELSRTWWRAYRDAYLVDRVFVVGFREWPPGIDKPADVDSGPIVEGVGASATAFGIAAARAMGDEELALRLESTAAIIEQMASLHEGSRAVAQSTLAHAIRFHAAAQPVRR